MDNLPDDMCRKCIGFGKLDAVHYNKRGRHVAGGKEVTCEDCGGSGRRATIQSRAQWPVSQGLGGLFGL